MKKYITAVTLDWETEPVDITRLEDAFRVYTPGMTKVTFSDQDNQPLPSPLEHVLRSTMNVTGTITNADLERSLDWWNRSMISDNADSSSIAGALDGVLEELKDKREAAIPDRVPQPYLFENA